VSSSVAPCHQAGSLSAELRKYGAQVLEIPFIEIRKPRSFRPLDSALKNLDTYDWLILTSVNGVEAMWARIETVVHQSRNKARLLRWKSGPLGPRSSDRNSGALALGLRIAAIGPATKKAIEQRGASRRDAQGIRRRIGGP
jgi:uroporphyrinogen-III synthase